MKSSRSPIYSATVKSSPRAARSRRDLRHVRVPLDPPRRARGPRSSCSSGLGARRRPPWPSPASASAPSRSTFRRSGPAWETRPRPGWSRRCPARSPSRSRPIWRRATATARRWWRGSTISISGQAAAALASSGKRRTPSTARFWSKDRAAASSRTCRCGRSASYFPMAVDQALVERALQGRVVALAQAFAGWAPRELGL